MFQPNLDAVGSWTEIKLSILRDYSKAYAQILTKQQRIRHFAYIDGFAGAGTHISKSTGFHIEGSPSVALGIKPPFYHYHFIDMDGQRAELLRQLAGEGRMLQFTRVTATLSSCKRFFQNVVTKISVVLCVFSILTN